jgi:hypothetical protein
LSTIATLIEPPFDPPVPEADDPPEPELFELPPQPVASRTTTTNRAAADPRRRMPLMVLLLQLERGGRFLRNRPHL